MWADGNSPFSLYIVCVSLCVSVYIPIHIYMMHIYATMWPSIFILTVSNCKIEKKKPNLESTLKINFCSRANRHFDFQVVINKQNGSFFFTFCIFLIPNSQGSLLSINTFLSKANAQAWSINHLICINKQQLVDYAYISKRDTRCNFLKILLQYFC